MEPLLQFLDLSVSEYRRCEREGTTGVTPVAYQDFSRDSETIASAFKRFGGTLIDTIGATDPLESPGRLITTRTTILEGLIAGHPSAIPAPVVFRETSNGVEARLGSGGPLDRSLPAILSILAAFASDLFDQTNLLGVAVDTSLGDPDRERFVAQLLCDSTIGALAPAATKLVVPILSDPPDVVETYDRDPEVRWVVLADRVLRRRSAAGRMSDLRQMLPTKERPIVLFLGAGASQSSGIKLGNFYRDKALDEFVGNARVNHPRLLYDKLEARGRFLPGERDLDPESLIATFTLERALRRYFSSCGRDRSRPRQLSRLSSTTAKRHCFERDPAGPRFKSSSVCCLARSL